jgi:hypothetical protein
VIFCIGLTRDYEAAIEAGPPWNLKQGRRPGYPGGAVFPTPEAARAFLAANNGAGRSIYGVAADWATDTEQLPGEPFRRLLRDAPLVRLATSPGQPAQR